VNASYLRRIPRRSLLFAAAGAVLPAPALLAATEAWPRRPLRLVVGFPPGSSPDLMARTLAEPLSRVLGQPVIVDNKAGAGGIIGVDAVAKASDAHTIGLTGNGPLTTARRLHPAVPYDVARDLRPISLVASSPFVLVSGPSVPARDIASLIAHARSQGEQLNYGSVGSGTGGHLSMELLKWLTGIRPVHVPFMGYPQVANALIAGQVQLAFMVPSIAVPQAKNGRLRIHGISSASRSAAFPEYTPIAEGLGKPEFDVESWNAVFAPAALPAAHADRLAQALSAIVKEPEIGQKLFDQGWQPLGTAPEGLARRIREDTARWGEIIRLTGVRSE